MSAKNKTVNIDSLVSAGVQIKGDMRFTGGIRIDGEVIGDVIGAEQDYVVIGQTGRVVGNIKAGMILADGRIIGNVEVGYIEVRGNAKIEGAINYTEMSIEKNAIVCGDVEYRKPEEFQLFAWASKHLGDLAVATDK